MYIITSLMNQSLNELNGGKLKKQASINYSNSQFICADNFGLVVHKFTLCTIALVHDLKNSKISYLPTQFLSLHSFLIIMKHETLR